MDAEEISKLAQEMGRRGGKARAKKMTPEERRESASKAGRASKRARKKREREKKKEILRQLGVDSKSKPEVDSEPSSHKPSTQPWVDGE